MSEHLFHNSQDQIFEIPDSLKPRCMKAFGWSEIFAEKSVKGYRQFIKLKYQHECYGRTTSVVLQPSPTVEHVWQQHVLDMGHYLKACDKYCGETIVHCSNNNGDGDACIRTTQIALKSLFGRDVDAEVWSFGDKSNADEKQAIKSEADSKPNMATSETVSGVGMGVRADEVPVVGSGGNEQVPNGKIPTKKLEDKSDPEVAAASKDFKETNTPATMSDDGSVAKETDAGQNTKEHTVEYDPNEIVILKVCDENGWELNYKMKRGMQFSMLVKAYSDNCGVPIDHFWFSLNGANLYPWFTAHDISLAMQDGGGYIDVLPTARYAPRK